MKKKKKQTYPLMWLSDKFCPYFEDIGLGIGCLKVIGNTQFSLPLCPAAVILDKNVDPVRKSWLPHGCSLVEPVIAPDPQLCLQERNWSPACLESIYSHREQQVIQQTVVFDYGAVVRLTSDQPLTDFKLRGASYGPCKLSYDENGLRVIEVSPVIRPLAYTIRFSRVPELTVDGKPFSVAPNNWVYFDRQIEWEFCWNKLGSGVEMEVEVNRHGELNKDFKELSFLSRLEKSRNSWDAYYRKAAPAINTPDDRLNKFCDYMAYVFRSNGVRRGGLLSHPYSMPKQTFCGWWMWDTCFHAIAGCWYGDRELAWGGMLNIENVQYPPGTIGAGTVTNQAFPHGVDVFESDDPMAPRLIRMPHHLPKEHGDGTHPPIFAQALKALWSVDGDDSNMRRLLPNALAYHDWFEHCRRSETLPGLLLIRRWSDSGMDNSPRWGKEGSGIYNTVIDSADWGIPMVTVDLNVYSVLEKQSLAVMLHASGAHEKALKLENEAAERTVLIHKLFWDESKGFYMDRNERDGAFIPIMSPTGFYPLLLEELHENRIEAMLGLLFDEKKFWSKMPIPSIAMDDPNFRVTHSYWSGGTWMNYTAYILRGLFRYRPDAAWKLLDRILDGLMLEGMPNIFENYNPLTAQGYDAANFGWAGLLVDVIIRDMLAIRLELGKLTFGRPNCPEDWNDFELDNLLFRQDEYKISCRKENGKWNFSIKEKQ